MSLFEELLRRNVLKVAALYGVAGWVILQVADILLPILGGPDWGMRLIFGLLLLGFPIAAILAWKYELTPDGIVSGSDVEQADDVTAETGKRIYVLIGALAVIAVGIMIAGPWLGLSQPDVVETAGVSESTELAGARFMNPAPEQSVAVLPFVNLSGDAADESISDGLSEEVLNRLAAIPGLFVAARTSSFHFKGQTGDVVDVARELRVRHLLEGSVRRSDERLRVTAQLIDATNGYHLWSETFDRPLVDIFKIEDEIAGRVTDALRMKLDTPGNADSSPPTESADAYLAFLEGRRQLAAGGIEGNKKAIDAFEQAILLDDEYAEAYANLAIAWAQRGWSEALTWHEFGPQIAAAASLALEHDDSVALAWVADGLATAYSGAYKMTDPAVLASMEKARAIAPHDPDVVHWYVQAQLWDRNSTAVINTLQAALMRDRLSPQLHFALCKVQFQMHENDKAVESCLRAAELEPENPRGLVDAAWSAAAGNRLVDAVLIEAQGLTRQEGDPFARCSMSIYYYEMGDFERARAWVRAGERIEPGHSCLRTMRAELSWVEGDYEAAAQEAEQFFADRRAQQSDYYFVDALQNLLFEYNLRKGDPEQAVASIMFGREIVPEIHAETLHSIVWRQFRILPALRQVDPVLADSLLAQYETYIKNPYTSLDYFKQLMLRCRLHAYRGRVEQAIEACRRQRSRHAVMREWEKLSIFEPVKDEPAWQAFMAEIDAERASQLEQLRASGEEPVPGALLPESLRAAND